MHFEKSLLIAVALFVGIALGAFSYDRLGGPPEPPKPKFKIINVHEHIKNREAAPKLLRAMNDLSIEKTVLCGSPRTTTHHGKEPFVGWEENNDEVIAIAEKWRGRFIPFVVMRPGVPDAVEKLKAWMANGAKGVKLFTGHSTFYKLRASETETIEYPLDHESMMPVYEYLEREQIPLLWHVNSSYFEEFVRVMDRYPNLRLNCPHHCMSIGRLAKIGEFFGKYPNMYVDTSHGYHEYMAQALRTISRRANDFREFYAQYPDRLLWGTDVVVTDKKRKTAAWIKRMARAYFGLFADAEFKLPVYDKGYRFQREEILPGLSLPEETLRKMYEENPRRWLKLNDAS